jgi:hypothetical protein
MNKIVLSIIYSIVIIAVIIFAFLFLTKYNKGSNADITPTIDAVLTCQSIEANVTVTWTYSYLSEEDSFNALNYAERNNCTFTHSRFNLNKLKAQEVLKNGNE